MNQARYNLAVLCTAAALNRTAVPLIVLAGGLVGMQFAPHPVWATLPMTLVVIGMGTFSYPAAAIMRRIGRRRGFLLACIVAGVATIIAGAAIMMENFTWFCSVMVLIGANQAFVQQYRFAAVENVPPERAGHAISLLLLASLFSAYVGPELGLTGRDWIESAPFAGAFFALAVVQIAAGLCLLGYRDTVPEPDASPAPERSGWDIVRQPEYIVAVSAAALSYAVMSLIMTATPISMHSLDGHSLDATALAIQGHIVAMFLPSVVTGTLIARFGVYRVMTAGVVFLIGCLVVAVWGQRAIDYIVALILLGVGWNFLFTTGSTLITRTYRSNERFKAEGLNDLIVFGTMALVTLGAGVLLAFAGWKILVLSCTPLLAVMLAMIAFLPRRVPVPEPAE